MHRHAGCGYKPGAMPLYCNSDVAVLSRFILPTWHVRVGFFFLFFSGEPIFVRAWCVFSLSLVFFFVSLFRPPLLSLTPLRA